jgi:hypothetical protein
MRRRRRGQVVSEDASNLRELALSLLTCSLQGCMGSRAVIVQSGAVRAEAVSGRGDGAKGNARSPPSHHVRYRPELHVPG